jgi:hypothetical protein
MATSALFVLATAGAACSSSSASKDPVAQPSSSSRVGNAALEYAKCMRENGVPDYKDPEVGPGGAVVLGPGDGADDPKAQAAQEACRDKMPQGAARDKAGPVDASRVTAWAKCIRENGVAKFPDPEVSGSMIKIKLGELGMKPDDPKMQKASAACQDKSPGGSLMFEG